jgi:hypothetical protein
MARGILVARLRRPEGWVATADDMWRASTVKHGKDSPGRRQFRAAFAELKEHGYLTAGREARAQGRHATVLTLTDVPHAGTSARTGETRNTAGRTDVPHAGTPEAPADVPHAGTPAPPAQTDVSAGRTDVPVSDVPHAGTSKEEDGETKTGWNTSSSAASQRTQDDDDQNLTEFGAFWIIHPKSRDRAKTLAEWRRVVASGVDPKQITQAAQGYARERINEPIQYTKHSFNWLRDGRYLDRYQPAPDPATGRPRLHAVSGDSYQPFQVPDESVYLNDKGF